MERLIAIHYFVSEVSQHQLVANQQSPKSGNLLHKMANSSSPDPFSTTTKKQKKVICPRETITEVTLLFNVTRYIVTSSIYWPE